MPTADPAPELPEHYFRHEFGRLVSVLSARFGVHRLELCEDAAQTALLRAVQSWSSRLPDEPGAWLYRVAQNHVLDVLRRERRVERHAAEVGGAEPSEGQVTEDAYMQSEVQDDVLRLLFVCADPSIPPESQLVLALKTLCGFAVEEIALRLFQSEEAVHKRLQRARACLRETHVEFDTPPLDTLADRLPRVHHALYLVFNEGYSSAQPDRLIRRELCDEAVRLTLLLAAHPVGATPETDALLALMFFHAARFDARVDGTGGLLVLEEQDRSLWDRRLVQRGLDHLRLSARGERFSRYHAEAGIAAEHCLAPTFAQTRWDEIARLYEVLDRIAPSPLHTLNRAIAIAEWQGPRAGLEVLETLAPPQWLLGYYLWDATLGELHRRTGDGERAARHLTRALELAPTLAEKDLLRRRLATCPVPRT
ncbi:MAG TPA: sigma-70 family RNA polymerase sigma factor [Polyangiaceae bacterium]|nr:sigma-70 family RNA polymerase sigma factor [Polyangiaceae bacterium]